MESWKSLAVCVVVFLGSPALAHDDAYLDTLKAPHGGQLRMAGPNHYELVVVKNSKTVRENPIVVYVTDMFRFRPIVNKVQTELWGQGPYPPRTIVEVHRLNQDDIFEVEGTFYSPVSKRTESAPTGDRTGLAPATRN